MLTDDKPKDIPVTYGAVHKGNTGYKGPPPVVPPTKGTDGAWDKVPELQSPGQDVLNSLSQIQLRDTLELNTPGFFDGPEIKFETVAPAPSNPKTLMGRLKLPIFSVMSAVAMAREAEALEYGALRAPRADGGTGYGPFNWREQKIEYMTYVDAAWRHIALAVDGEDLDPESLVCHLAHAKATLGILIDAIETVGVIDNRPAKTGKLAQVLAGFKQRQQISVTKEK